MTVGISETQLEHWTFLFEHVNVNVQLVQNKRANLFS